MSFDRLFHAKSVALVGASATPQKGAGKAVEFLKNSGYKGRVYPVNPAYEQIGDWKCYPSMEAVPETVDAMLLIVPVAAAFEALEIGARQGVPFAVLTSGGFGEGRSGADGEEKLARLRKLCADTGMKILGPNTIGMVNFYESMPLTFADWYGRDTGQRDGVAVVTNSGSVGGLIFSSLQINKVGIKYWIATGNEAVVEVADVIDELSDDPDIHTICCFMEGVMDGRRFMAAAEKARLAGKRILVLKAGGHEVSARSTEAHTMKRSSDAETYDAIFRQLGVSQVVSLQELTQAVKVAVALGDKAGGHTIGIISASGGACSVFADHVADHGLDLPLLEDGLQEELMKSIPVYGSTLNPVDVSADIVARRDILTSTMETLKKDDRVDTWLIFGRPIIDRYHMDLREFWKTSGKAVVVVSGVELPAEIQASLDEDKMVVVQDPELCIRALGTLHRGAAAKGKPRRDWMAMPKRVVGNGAVDAAALLAKQGLQVSKEGGAGLKLAIVQDIDFGPVLTIGRAGRDGGWRGPRVLRALPADEQDIAKALTEFDQAELGDLGLSSGDVVKAALSLVKLYQTETSVAEVAVRVGAGGKIVAAEGKSS